MNRWVKSVFLLIAAFICTIRVSSTRPIGATQPIAYKPNFKMDVIDVGQVDCILLELPNGQKTLIFWHLNTYSIVLKVKYNKTSFLLTCDATTVSEAGMIHKVYNLKADVLKAGHRGAPYASSQEFLLKAILKYEVISVGKGNVYVHPAATTLAKLKGIGAQVYRTD